MQSIRIDRVLAYSLREMPCVGALSVEIAEWKRGTGRKRRPPMQPPRDGPLLVRMQKRGGGSSTEATSFGPTTPLHAHHDQHSAPRQCLRCGVWPVGVCCIDALRRASSLVSRAGSRFSIAISLSPQFPVCACGLCGLCGPVLVFPFFTGLRHSHSFSCLLLLLLLLTPLSLVKVEPGPFLAFPTSHFFS